MSCPKCKKHRSVNLECRAGCSAHIDNWYCSECEKEENEMLPTIEEVPTSKANETQIGGDHYKKGGEEHWDRAWRLKYDNFQYIITKWVERWRDKGGLEDLKKARHAMDKYIELVESDLRKDEKGGADVAYTNQD